MLLQQLNFRTDLNPASFSFIHFHVTYDVYLIAQLIRSEFASFDAGVTGCSSAKANRVADSFSSGTNNVVCVCWGLTRHSAPARRPALEQSATYRHNDFSPLSEVCRYMEQKLDKNPHFPCLHISHTLTFDP